MGTVKVRIALLFLLCGIGAAAAGVRGTAAEETGKQTASSGESNALSSFKENLSDALSTLSDDQIDGVLEFLQEKAENGELKDGQDIADAIGEGEGEFGFSLSETQKEKLLEGIETLRDLGLTPEQAVEQAGALYEKYGRDVTEHLGEAVADSVTSAVKNSLSSAVERFFSSVREAVKGAVSAFFEKL